MTVTGRLNGRPTVVGPTTDAGPRGLAALAGAREHIDIVIPRTAIAGRMRLVTRSERASIESEVLAYMKALSITSLEQYSAETAVRTLAIAVRDPQDEHRTLDSVEEWRECDDDQIAALWKVYQDLAERVDPLGADGGELEPGELDAMIAAAKKKEFDRLISYGSRRLAIFAITTAAPPAS